MALSRPPGRSINRRMRTGPVDDIFSAQGMIPPAGQFVDNTGTLTPASFRYLHSLFLAIARIEERLDVAGIPRADH